MLTPDEIEEIAMLNLGYDRQVRLRDFARAVEQAARREALEGLATIFSNADKVDLADAIRALIGSDAPEMSKAPFQARVQPWMMACFGAEISADRIERNHRFFEEAAELVQACGMTASEAHQLVDYTWPRPVGEKSQEVGGVMVTLAALCLANGLDMHAAGETELDRINRPDMVIRIRAKQASKPKHSPLPEAPAMAERDPYGFEVLLGEQMYIDSSMQYRNGTVNLTLKRKSRAATDLAKDDSQ